MQEVIQLFEQVREIPYRLNGARTPEEVVAQNGGYCLSKHRLLQKLYQDRGITTELCFIPFRFDQIRLPTELRGWWLATRAGYHVFLKMWHSDIDATFPSSLREYYVSNGSRDGIQSQTTIIPYTEYFMARPDLSERDIKNRLSDPTPEGPDDTRRIETYNTRLENIEILDKKG